MYTNNQLIKIFRKTRKTLFTLTIYLLLFGFLVFILIYLGEGYFYDIYHSKIKDNHVSDWNNIAIIFLTLIIVCAGWMQLKNLNQTTTSDFLLRIDERYGSPEILKARVIIHELYCLTYHKEIDINIHISKIAKRILFMKNKVDSSESFIYLYNFLNFLETISYFANNNYISNVDVDELLGGSVKYYYLIFKLLIEDKRRKYQSDYYYCELETLAKRLHEKYPSQPPSITLSR